jgi:hypothetical protein
LDEEASFALPSSPSELKIEDEPLDLSSTSSAAAYDSLKQLAACGLYRQREILHL